MERKRKKIPMSPLGFRKYNVVLMIVCFNATQQWAFKEGNLINLVFTCCSGKQTQIAMYLAAMTIQFCSISSNIYGKWTNHSFSYALPMQLHS